MDAEIFPENRMISLFIWQMFVVEYCMKSYLRFCLVGFCLVTLFYHIFEGNSSFFGSFSITFLLVSAS